MAIKLLDGLEKPHGVLQSQLSQSCVSPAGIKHLKVSRGEEIDWADTPVMGVHGGLGDTFLLWRGSSSGVS